MRLHRLPRNALRFLRLSRQERADLIAAVRAVVSAKRLMRKQPLGKLVSVIEPAEGARPVDREAAKRVSEAVHRVSRNVPFEAACLVRSLAIQRMLVERGLDPGNIKIGVHWSDDGFEAHAWVEQGDKIIGDTRAYVSRFTPVTDVTTVKF
jgi:hypothetical protein